MKKRSEKTVKLQKAFFWIVSFVCFFSFLAYTFFGKDGIVNLMDVLKEKEMVSAQNEVLIRKNMVLVEEIQKLKQDKFIEQTIRSHVGYIRPNEIVFLIDETK